MVACYVIFMRRKWWLLEYNSDHKYFFFKFLDKNIIIANGFMGLMGGDGNMLVLDP